MNLLPAILLGGPPHAGKSALFQYLTHALHERGIPHCGLQVCPDGDCFDADNQEQVRLIRVTDEWGPDFVRRICHDMERRYLPLLVDLGGHPAAQESCVFRACTHSLLLLRPEQEENAQMWRRLVSAHGLLPLAELDAQLQGISLLNDDGPVLKGTFGGLPGLARPADELVAALVERIALLFSSYSRAELERTQLELAPVDLVVNLDRCLERLAPQTRHWEQALLPQLLTELPATTPLAVYGSGPDWVYGALAAHAGQQPLYQFDPRIGWMAPPPLLIGTPGTPPGDLHHFEQATVLSIRIAPHLDYQQAHRLPWPPVPVERGLILDGRLPRWLTTALVRLYQEAAVAWIACGQAPQAEAVVVSSRTPAPVPGKLVAFPTQ